jgi:hypothetical protein
MRQKKPSTAAEIHPLILPKSPDGDFSGFHVRFSHKGTFTPFATRPCWATKPSSQPRSARPVTTDVRQSEDSKQLSPRVAFLQSPAIIAVSGFGGAGKSSIASALGSKIGAPVLGIDSFIKDRTIMSYAYWEIMDFKRLEGEVLRPFLEGKPVRYDGDRLFGPEKSHAAGAKNTLGRASGKPEKGVESDR